jgi:DNA-binding NarL/FixJ family response regulator
MTIRVVLADDDRLLRAGLALVLGTAEDLQVVAEAGDGIEAVEQALANSPDVVLMDVRMPGIDGIQATRRLVAARPDTKILILTTFPDDEYVYGALRAGASGFLLKRASPERLLDAVRTVAAGEALLDPSVTRDLIHRYLATGEEASPAPTAQTRRRLDRLTDREREVLLLIGQGRSNAEIAELLVIAESTAKTHVKRVLAKIDVHDRAQAVVFAYQSGLIASRRTLGG